nr:TonB-dependent receptor [Shewanella dokdonensis]
MNGSLRYNYNDLTATLYAYYLPKYLNNYLSYMSAGTVYGTEHDREVDSYLWFDLTASYQLTNSLRINFAGRNIFDKKPPLAVVDQRPYDSSRYNAAGRTFSLEVQYEF